MQRGKLVAISFIFILVISLVTLSVVYALGSSTGGDNPRNVNDAANETEDSNQTQNDSQKRMNNPNRMNKLNITNTTDCEMSKNRRERIKCRLQYRIENSNLTEESCRNVTDSQACRVLYNKVAACYYLNGVQKDQCFKRIAGFIKNKVSDEANSTNKTSIRNYIVFLLYDLQERAESAQQNGTITVDQAAEVIDLIVQIKQAVMTGQNKTQIRPMFQELKTKWRTLNI